MPPGHQTWTFTWTFTLPSHAVSWSSDRNVDRNDQVEGRGYLIRIHSPVDSFEKQKHRALCARNQKCTFRSAPLCIHQISRFDLPSPVVITQCTKYTVLGTTGSSPNAYPPATWLTSIESHQSHSGQSQEDLQRRIIGGAMHTGTQRAAVRSGRQEYEEYEYTFHMSNTKNMKRFGKQKSFKRAGLF